MGNIENINAWFANFEHRMREEVPDIVAETATAFYQSKFRTQEWDGVPWENLSPNYAKRKRRSKEKILTASGILVNSIRPTIQTSNRVTITAGNSRAPYARVHNEGLRVRGTRQVKSYTNNNFMGTGRKQLIKAHSRTVNYQMPKRQFMGHSVQLNRLLTRELTQFFNKK